MTKEDDIFPTEPQGEEQNNTEDIQETEDSDLGAKVSPFETGKEKETEAMRQQRLGAECSLKCKEFKDTVNEVLLDLPESTKDKIETWMANLEENVSAKSISYEEYKNALSFLICKVFFDLDGVKNPQNLEKRISKIRAERYYSPKISKDIEILLSHVPENLRKFKEVSNRQKTASDFSMPSNAKGLPQSYSYYLSEYSKGNISKAEFLKATDNDRCRQEKNRILSEAKTKFGWVPLTEYRGLSSYSISADV